MKLCVGMKIWKNVSKNGFYVITEINERTVTLNDQRYVFECHTNTVIFHIKKMGLVSSWKVGYYGA